MEAAQALRELTEISSQIEAACLFDAQGQTIAGTLPEGPVSDRFVAAARKLLDECDAVAHDPATGPLHQLEAATLGGSVFVVRDAELAVAAVTRPEPTSGLVFYDLKSCLRAAATEGDEDGKPRPKKRKQEPSPSESAA
jgi:predicted regulator of Ras-like GTPase activity (Roadblock/LC7/MglB family)